MNPLQSLYYVSPACLVSLLVPFLAVEWPRIVAAKAAGKVHFNPPVLLANALAAFALNLAVFLLIGKTSALTMNIAGVIKDWMLIFFSYYLFRAPVTRLNLIGYIFCCSGVVVYNHIKLKALKAKVAKEGNSKGDDDEAPGTGHGDLQRPLLPNSIKRTKDDIMSEIRRLQSEMEAIDGRVAVGGPTISALAGAEGINGIGSDEQSDVKNVSVAFLHIRKKSSDPAKLQVMGLCTTYCLKMPSRHQ
eukprot:gene2500-2804_t